MPSTWMSNHRIELLALSLDEATLSALVVYGTRWGGTIGVSNKIEDALRKNGFKVDVVDARKKMPNISNYHLVIVGSGIRADRWTKESLNFLEKNVPVLRDKKIALFVSCEMANAEKNAAEAAREKYLTEVAAKYGLHPISYGFFGGLLDFGRSHGILADIIVSLNGRNLRRHGLNTKGVTDKRDWTQIENWTIDIVKTFPEKS